MLSPVVDDMRQELPHSDTIDREIHHLVCPARLPLVVAQPLSLEHLDQLSRLRERLELRSWALALQPIERVPPAHQRAKPVDEDPPQAALVDDIRPRPDVVVDALEPGKYAPRRPAVVLEQK